MQKVQPYRERSATKNFLYQIDDEFFRFWALNTSRREILVGGDDTNRTIAFRNEIRLVARDDHAFLETEALHEIGRASCRERV